MDTSVEKISRWSYHQQMLGQQGSSLEHILQHITGVHSEHPTAPLSLLARTKNFSEKAFFDLERKKIALRIPAMRLSTFMVPARQASMIFSGTIPPPSDDIWEKRYAKPEQHMASEDYHEWKAQILKAIQKPKSFEEIKAATDIPEEQLEMVLNRMAYEGHVLQTGSDQLRSNAVSYISSEKWHGVNFQRVKPEIGLAWLAREYMHAYGPVRVKDFQWWSGVSDGMARAAMQNLATIRVGSKHHILTNDFEKFDSFVIPTEDTLDILPPCDSYIMGYAPDGRERFILPENQQHLYENRGKANERSLGAILVNGKVHGSWEHNFEDDKMNVTIHPFEKFQDALKNQIKAKFDEIGGVLRAKEIECRYIQ